MHQAKSSLSSLVEQAVNGEEIIIAKAGRPQVRLVSVAAAQPRKLGRWRGKVKMSKDFHDPLPPEMLAAWNG